MPHTATCSLLPVGVRERIRRVSKQKCVVEIKAVSWVREKLHVQAKQNKEFTPYSPSAGRCLAVSRKASFTKQSGYLEDKCHNSKHPPPGSLLLSSS